MPDPLTEIRLTGLHALRGTNFWSRRPVVRMDLAIGAFDEISSAEVPGLPETLAEALPGLIEHRCSVGERGGFLQRLRRGTYAAHVTEHVALELQNMIGHDVGYGRARGGEAPGEYTLVFEHRHEAVGLRAAALALGVVQQAFAGDGADAVRETVARAVDEMAALARTPDTPAPDQRVLCAVTGSRGRREAAALIRRRVGAPARAGGRRGPVRTGDLVVEVAPSYLLEQGLPYARSTLAVVLDVAPDDVSPRFREPDRARQLVTVLVDGVVPGGLAVLPADDAELHEYARRRECRVATFAADGPVRDAGIAQATAWAADGRVVLQRFAECVDGGPLDPEMPPAAQVAAALAGFALAALALEAPNGSRAARADGASATERTRPAGEPRAPEQGAQPPGPGTRP